MADIAVVFHWPLSDLIALDLAELMHWREQARRRCQPDE
ncbi:MAG TPA: GpE family phage tail protein [Rhodocyclaceae bacterium]|nr:GpE family phage tail protein [Rhodocyclaceae bacterium]